MTYWVYILKCSDGSYYTGQTSNLAKRLAEHETKSFPDCYTASRLPVKLIFSQAFNCREEAFAAERQIKGWNRAKKEALIRDDWNEVSRLAKSRSRVE